MQKYLTTKKKQMYNDDLMPICICGVNHPITHYPLTVTPPEILGPAKPIHIPSHFTILVLRSMYTRDYWCFYPVLYLLFMRMFSLFYFLAFYLPFFFLLFVTFKWSRPWVYSSLKGAWHLAWVLCR